MTSTQPDAHDVAGKIADALNRANIDYAIGGAIALGFAAEPRGTVDVDIAVFVASENVNTLFDVLSAAGCDIDRRDAVANVEKRMDFRTSCDAIRVDVFLPSFELYESARKRRKSVRLGSRNIWIWAPEDLAVFKSLFNRAKDWVDIHSIVATVGQHFDRGYVREWIVRLLGNDDDRVARWDRVCSDVDAE